LTTKNVRFYRPELDVLRFFAFLLVFLHHGLNPTNGLFDSFRVSGALGVCLFFMLSSYLITELLEREETQSGSIHLRAFYLRRGLRIWPLYVSFLLFDFLLERYLNPGRFTGARLLAFLLVGGNWYVAQHGFIETISTPLWSISVEEQFYILWPSTRKYLHRLGSVLFSVTMFVVAYAAIAFLCRKGADVTTGIWVNSFVQFQFFSTGALLALALGGRVPKFHPLLRCLLFAAGVAILVAAQRVFEVKESSGVAIFHLAAPGYLCANAGCILLFLGFLGESRLGGSRLLVYLGKISYGLYVFHWMMLRLSLGVLRHVLGFQWMQTPEGSVFELLFALVLTVAIASVSYRFFELPILRYKSRFEYIRTRS
jgi:peptidoglycan/LPS O-acetylase OafA/YrhL